MTNIMPRKKLDTLNTPYKMTGVKNRNSGQKKEAAIYNIVKTPFHFFENRYSLAQAKITDIRNALIYAVLTETRRSITKQYMINKV